MVHSGHSERVFDEDVTDSCRSHCSFSVLVVFVSFPYLCYWLWASVKSRVVFYSLI